MSWPFSYSGRFSQSKNQTNLSLQQYDWPSEKDLTTFQENNIFKDGSEFLDPRSLKKYELGQRHDTAVRIARICRYINVRLQTKQKTWKIMDELKKKCNDIKGDDADLHLKQNAERQKEQNAEMQKDWQEGQITVMYEELRNFLKKEHDAAAQNPDFLPGPVGDHTIHNCFLLGFYGTGLELLHSSPELINRAYKNDLDVWRELNKNTLSMTNKSDTVERIPEKREDGLYTGETILHIAIVKQETQLVQKLLSLHSQSVDLLCRAVGVFFQPKNVPWREPPSVRWQDRFKDWVLSIDRKFAVVKTEFNPDSRCYYGEFPLSFAASVGNLDMCECLYKCKKDQLETMYKCKKDQLEAIDPDEENYVDQAMTKPLFEMLKLKTRQAVEHYPHSFKLWAFVNACDTFGNTAMHMAVLHARKTANESSQSAKTAHESSQSAKTAHESSQSAKTAHESSQSAICQHMKVVDWLMLKKEGRCCLETCNLEGYTPLTLAARIGNVKMFDYILNHHMSSTVWRYGKVQMRKRDLRQVNTFKHRNGAIPNDSQKSNDEISCFAKPRSALEVIVMHEVVEFAKHKVIKKLIGAKWDEFGLKMYFYRTLLPYSVFLVFFALVLMLRSDEVSQDSTKHLSADGLSSASNIGNGSYCIRGALGWSWTGDISDNGQEVVDGSARKWRFVTLIMEAGVVCVGSSWLVVKGWRERHLERRDLDMSEDGKLSAYEVAAFVYKNIHFLQNFGISFVLLIAGISRLCCNDWLELMALSVASILLFSNILNILMPFKYIGVLVIIIFRMLVGDIFRFFVVYLAMLSGFAFGMLPLTHLSQELAAIYGSTYAEVFMRLFWVALGADGPEDLSESFLETQKLAIALHVVWVLISSVLMLNLLIAMMGRTFETISEDAQCTWIFPFARLVLRYERIHWRREQSIVCNFKRQRVGLNCERGSGGTGSSRVDGYYGFNFGTATDAAEAGISEEDMMFYDFCVEDVDSEDEGKGKYDGPGSCYGNVSTPSKNISSSDPACCGEQVRGAESEVCRREDGQGGTTDGTCNVDVSCQPGLSRDRPVKRPLQPLPGLSRLSPKLRRSRRVRDSQVDNLVTGLPSKECELRH